MVKVKSAAEAAEKWARVTPQRAADYEQGVRTAEDWASRTAAQESAYEQGVTAAIARKAFSKGVRAKGTAGWQAATLAKGPSRFASGIQAGKDNYAQGMERPLQVLSSLSLPPRGPRGDPKNLERVRVVMEALRKAKTGATSSGGK